MSKTARIWLMIAASLVLVGCILFGSVMTMFKWDFTKLGTSKFETNEYEISEKFSNIAIETDTADLTFALSDDGTIKVECYEEKKAKHAVTVSEDTLAIKLINEKAWYDYISFNFASPKITIYLSQAEYASLFISESTGGIILPKDFTFCDVTISLSTGDVTTSASASGLVKIKTSTGNICVERASFGSLDLSASTGDIAVSDVAIMGDANICVSTGKTKISNAGCKNLTSTGSTGNILLNNVISNETISVKRSTGDVKFDSSDAAELLVETSTGDVIGNLLTDKVFIAHTDTGKVAVPKTATGGKCEVTTNTGDIKLEIR